jgi:hypothetical protein
VRASDLAPPAVSAHPIPPTNPIGRWPAVLTVAVERLPQEAYAWDDEDPDVTYDDTTPERVWDAPFTNIGFIDAVCDLQALTIDSGTPDDLGLYGAGSAVFQLDNRSGAWSRYTVDGRFVYFAPGRRVCIWATIAGTVYWLFSGRVGSWTDHADDTVEVEAFNGVAELAQESGGPWTPGTLNQRARDRIAAVCSLWQYSGAVAGDLGTLQLGNPSSERTPWDEIQVTSLSDGGITFCDADGQLIYRDRAWRVGRGDQVTVPAFTDNVCSYGIPVTWDTELAGDDDGLATSVRLSNYAVTPLTVTAAVPSDANAWYGNSTRYRLSHPEPDLWQTAPDGQALADHLLTMQSTPRVAVRGFTLHLPDPHQNLWVSGIDRRIGDRVRFVHDFPAVDGTTTLDITAVLGAVRHEITPDTWVSSYVCSRAVGYSLPENWDETIYTWDDPAPAAVWSY